MKNLCIDCGDERHPKAKVGRCNRCQTKFKQVNQIVFETERLVSLGYEILSGPHETKFQGKRSYELRVPSCGHVFNSRYDNIDKASKIRPNELVCPACGGKKRAEKGLSGFVAKYGRSWDEEIRNEYLKKTRTITEKTYRDNIDLINPARLVRSPGHSGFHLDHIIPIAICFRRSLPAEIAGSLDNLRLIPGTDNLKKSWYGYDNNLLQNFLRKAGIAYGSGIDETINDLVFLLKERGLCPVIRDKSILIDHLDIQVVGNDISVVSQGIDRIMIRPLEWLENEEKILSRILHKCGLSKKIFARKCTVDIEVSREETRSFLNKNHMQGYIGSPISIGLRLDGQLVSMMTFGKPRFNKNHEFELLRFCNILGHTVLGGASRIFNCFLKNKNPENVISYSNTRWGNGQLYRNLGFELLSESKGSHHYLESSTGKIVPRYGAQKHKLQGLVENFNPGISGKENMEAAGYIKVTDPGSETYVWRS